jgi:hypothetical protein
VNQNINKEKEFKLEEKKDCFKNKFSKSNLFLYLILIILFGLFIYIFKINWYNLNQYDSIKSEERYPQETVYKEQIAYYGQDYNKFKEQSSINKILKDKELYKYWANCIGSCEIPSTDRFRYISEKQDFINWACNERIKEYKFTAIKYAIWKLNKEGCVLTNLEEIKKKDKEEIAHLRLEKQKEIEIYLIILLVNFLIILSLIDKIIKK